MAVEITLSTTHEGYYGYTMEYSLSAVAAQLVMEILAETVIKKCNLQMSLFHRYVDNYIAAVPEGSENDVLKYFKSLRSRLRD